MIGSGTWWHFDYDEALLRKYRPHAHIPIRHPLDVAESWAQRDKTGDVVAKMLRCYACMFTYLEDNDATFHRMEDLPRIKGTIGEHVQARNMTSRVRRFQEAVTEIVIVPYRSFFAQFYEDLTRGAGHLRRT